MTEQDRKALMALLWDVKQSKGFQYFRPPCHAEQRRQYEKRHTHERIVWEDDGHVYGARMETSCSVSHVYVLTDYTRDGKHVSLNVIKESAKRNGALPEGME